MPTIGLTSEQRRVIEQAGGQPVRIDDPVLRESYVLIRADLYERFREMIERRSSGDPLVPDGIRRSQLAFFRDLPALLEDRSLRGRYVAYHGDERIGIAGDDTPLIRECLRRGLKREEHDILVIEPQTPEPEEIDDPSCWSEA
jgi:hypothetical protein